jgi:hypothetical protein
VVEVKALQTVEVVIGTAISPGVVGGVVENSDIELYVAERLLGLIDVTIAVEDWKFEAELADSVIDSTEIISGLVYDSMPVIADDVGATSTLVDADEVSATELVSTLDAESTDSALE